MNQTVELLQRTLENARMGEDACGQLLDKAKNQQMREELMRQATELSRLPLTTLKLHQLQVVRGTRMAEEYAERPADFHIFAMEDYIETVIDYVERLSPNIVLERFASQSPKELLIAPDWGLKNHELVDKVKRRMRERSTWQGRLYDKMQ